MHLVTFAVAGLLGLYWVVHSRAPATQFCTIPTIHRSDASLDLASVQERKVYAVVQELWMMMVAHTVRKEAVTPTFLYSELVSDYTHTAGALK